MEEIIFKHFRFSISDYLGKLAFTAFSLLLIIALTACNINEAKTITQQASSNLPPESSLIDQGNQYTVSIESVAFIPSELNIKIGDTVTWINNDTNIHTITSWYHDQDEDDVTHTYIGEVWDSGDIEPGSSFSRIFNQIGNYEYVSLPLYVQTPLLHYKEFLIDVIGMIIVK